MRVLKKLDACGRDSQRTSGDKSTYRVGCDDDGDKRQKGIIDKGSAVYSELVETKKKGNQRRQDCVKAEEGREGNEYANRKSKRRPLRWIIQREQTAKGGTKHFVRQAFTGVPGGAAPLGVVGPVMISSDNGQAGMPVLPI